MQSLEKLNVLDKTTSEIFFYASQYHNFISTKTDLEIEKSIREIRKKFLVDYTKPMKMSAKELQNLKIMVAEFLRDKKDNFNTHYIQLLACHIDDIKILKGGTSFLEYAPSPLLPISATNKIFTLFLPKRIDSEKIATALLLNYLNNYRKASTRFKTLLRRYLKGIKYSRDVDIYFNMVKIGQILIRQPPEKREKYLENASALFGIRECTLNTNYFKDAVKGF